MDFNVSGSLHGQQLDSFNQLKQRISEQHGPDEARDEPRLLRFLIARDYDVSKATTMLSNHIVWRRKHNIGDLLHSYKPPEVLEKYYPETTLGFSRDGDVVSYTHVGGLDLIGFSKSITTSEFVLFIARYMERYKEMLRKKSEEDGKLYQTWILILDFENSNLSQAMSKDGMNMVSALMPVYEANYPERLKCAIIINASISFTIIYSIMKPFLHPKTKEKVKVFGKNGWKEELTKLVEPSVLPAFLGGTRTDPNGDPMCSSFVRRTKPIPQSYYIPNKVNKSIYSEPGVKKYIVPRYSRITINVNVPDPGSQIEWKFQTENYEIGFGLRYSSKTPTDTNDIEDVVPVHKMDTRVFCETGMYYCERPGHYIIVFDNRFSWLRSKELYVRADLVKPDGHKICVTI